MKTNWSIKKLGEVAEIIVGKTPATIDYLNSGEYKVLKYRDITKNGINWNMNDKGFVKEDSLKGLKKVQIGDLLITSAGHSSEKIGEEAVVVDELPSQFKKVFFASELICYRASPKIILPKLLLLYILSEFGQNQLKKIIGDSVHLTKEKSGFIEIPLPGIEDQKRIVKKLEAILEKIEESRTVRQQSAGETQKILRSVLKKTFDDLSKRYNKKEIKDFSEVKGGKRLPAGQQFSAVKTEYPYIRVVDFKDYSIDTAGLRYLGAATQRQISRYTISDKDAYISIAGTIGTVGTVPPQLSGANLTENAAKIVFNEENGVNNRFIVYFLDSSQGKEEIKKRTNQVGQPKLALMRIETIEVPLPDLIEQEKIVAYLDGLSEKVQSLQKLQKEQLQDLEALQQSVLHQAFQGEL
ncbi:MAG: restriction endonuclease subunit S [bacterium]|nr:restriction endonuclease subunit S [bacterium]